MYKLIIACLALMPLGASAESIFALDERTDPVYVIVLDGSGSMTDKLEGGTDKMTAAKQALKQAAAAWSQNTRVSLFAFSENKSGEVYPLSRFDREKFEAAVDSITPGGGTPLGSFMRQAAQRLIDAHKASLGYGERYKLVVITDGESNHDEVGLLDRVVSDMMQRTWVYIDVVGVGMRSEHTLAKKVNRYRDAQDPEQLAREIKSMVAETVDANLTNEDIAPVVEAIEAIDGGVLIAMAASLGAGGDHDVLTDPNAVKQQVSEPAAAPDSPSASAPQAQNGEKEPSGPSAMLIIIAIIVAIGILFSIIARLFD